MNELRTKLKIEYVTTNTSIKKLAEKYGMRKATLESWSKQDEWVAARKQHQADIVAETSAKIASLRAEELAQELRVAEAISNVLASILEDSEQFNRHIVQNDYCAEDGSVVRVNEEMIFKKVDTKALKDVAQTLKLVEELKRSMLNILTMEQHNRNLRENRRLQIEEERLEMQKQQVDYAKPDKEIKVVITGYEEGWAD